MRIDLVLPNEGPFAAEALRMAPRLEDMGFGGFWLTDHVVGVPEYPAIYGDHWLEILSSLAYLAGTTRRARLGTGILVVPYRDPVLTAKMLATIDVLSGGRVDFGVGTGWAEAEFRALGRQALFAQRGAATDEALDVILACWRSTGDVGFQGRWTAFDGVAFAPGPVQPRIPVWVGSRGVTDKALRRVARHADYWHPTREVTPEAMKSGGARLEALAGRPIARSIRLTIPASVSAAELTDQIASYEDAGCVQAAIDLRAATLADFMAAAERLAATLSEPDKGRLER